MRQTVSGFGLSTLGLSAVGLFAASFTLFSTLTEGFDPLNDVVSLLGARDQPLGLWWNIFGFMLVGVLIAGFGYRFGQAVKDRLTGVLLLLFGVTFMAIALPITSTGTNETQTAVHFVIVCLSMAFWCGALARLASLPAFTGRLKHISYGCCALVIAACACHGADLLTIAHFQRLFFGGIFLWIALISVTQHEKP